MGLLGCGASPLLEADEEFAEIVLDLSQSENDDDSDLSPNLLRLNEILIEVFGEDIEPLPEDEIRALNITSEDVLPAEIFRYGGSLPRHPEDDANAGAFVGRSTSIDYSTAFQWAVTGDWTEIFSGTYSKFDRVYKDNLEDAFLSGDVDRLVVNNDIINLADRGIIFAYESKSVFRRVRNENLPGGEALLHWERMAGKAKRLEGGNDAYMKFLLNFQIYMKLNKDLSWRVANSWTAAGGSFLFFSGSANSGDIGKGIRRDFENLETYAAGN